MPRNLIHCDAKHTRRPQVLSSEFGLLFRLVSGFRSPEARVAAWVTDGDKITECLDMRIAMSVTILDDSRSVTALEKV